MTVARSAIIVTAERTRQLHLSAMDLTVVPAPALQLTTLIRLDLSYNQILSLPASIGRLTALEQLWLNNNPLGDIHPDIQLCSKLKVLDLRDTAIKTLPREMGRMKWLFDVDLRGTPLNEEMKGLEVNTLGLVAYLDTRDQRHQLRTSLMEHLSTRLYREVWCTPEGSALIPPLIDAVISAFPQLADLKQVVRHCDRLFPAELKQATDPGTAAVRLKEKFIALRRDNERTRLSSDLELKMRAIYYDRIDPQAVERYIKDIYEYVPLLEDIQFIIQHAPIVLPHNAVDITGKGVLHNMVSLQDELTRARVERIVNLTGVLSGLYPDADSPYLAELAVRVAAAFNRGRFADKKEIENLKKLSADALEIFPAEISMVDPTVILATFKNREKKKTPMMMT